jgi:hypothetical protein
MLKTRFGRIAKLSKFWLSASHDVENRLIKGETLTDVIDSGTTEVNHNPQKGTHRQHRKSQVVQIAFYPVQALDYVLHRVCIGESKISLAIVPEVNARCNAYVSFLQYVEGKLVRIV